MGVSILAVRRPNTELIHLVSCTTSQLSPCCTSIGIQSGLMLQACKATNRGLRTEGMIDKKRHRNGHDRASTDINNSKSGEGSGAYCVIMQSSRGADCCPQHRADYIMLNTIFSCSVITAKQTG